MSRLDKLPPMSRLDQLMAHKIEQAVKSNEALFCAAVSGLCANRVVMDYPTDESAQQVVDLARAIVRATYNNDPNQELPDYVGTMPETAK